MLEFRPWYLHEPRPENTGLHECVLMRYVSSSIGGWSPHSIISDDTFRYIDFISLCFNEKPVKATNAQNTQNTTDLF